MIRRPPSIKRSRKHLPRQFYPPAAALAVTVTLSSGHMRLTGSGALVVSAVPVEIKANATSPTGFTIVSPNVVDLTFAVPPTTAQTWVIPANAPSIRGAAGGVLSAATGTF